jgi:hypothetical protein
MQYDTNNMSETQLKVCGPQTINLLYDLYNIQYPKVESVDNDET